MIVYRRIRIADVDQFTAFAIAAIPDDPALAISLPKVRGIVAHFAVSADFQLAAYQNGVPVGGIAATMVEMPFHERCEAVICFCYATVPGVGARLLRALMRWVMDDMRIRRVVWSMNVGFDTRIRGLARRMGFNSEAPMLLYTKG